MMSACKTPMAQPLTGTDSLEYVFIYDISTGTPVQKQIVTIPNSYSGIAFDPVQRVVAGAAPLLTRFYVSSGMGDYPYTGRSLHQRKLQSTSSRPRQCPHLRFDP